MKKNNLSITIGVLSVIITIIFVMFYFLYNHLFVVGQRIYTLSQKAQLDIEKDKNNKDSIKTLSDIAPTLQIINSYFVDGDGEVAFIEDVESKAKDFNLETNIISVQIEKTKDLTAKGLEYLSLKMSVKGTWSNVYKFISLLPNMPYQIMIDQADISNISDKEQKTASLWQGSFSLKVIKQVKSI